MCANDANCETGQMRARVTFDLNRFGLQVRDLFGLYLNAHKWVNVYLEVKIHNKQDDSYKLRRKAAIARAQVAWVLYGMEYIMRNFARWIWFDLVYGGCQWLFACIIHLPQHLARATITWFHVWCYGCRGRRRDSQRCYALTTQTHDDKSLVCAAPRSLKPNEC